MRTSAFALAITAILSLFTHSTLSAQSTAYDMGELVMDETYTIPESAAGAALTGTITPSKSGEMMMIGLDGLPELYTTSDHQIDSKLSRVWVPGSFGNDWACTYQVEANTTYYIYASTIYLWNANTLRFEMTDDLDIKLEAVYPSEGSTINTLTNGTGEIVLTFNCGVVYNNAYLQAGTQTAQTGTGILEASRNININIKSALNNLFASGALDPDGGDTVVLHVEGIKASDSNVYGDDGSISLDFKSGGKLAQLVSCNFTQPYILKSYIPQGDPAGTLVFTFDKELAANGMGAFSLSVGDVETEGAYYHETLPIEISGKQVSVNLCGKLRDLNAYVAFQNQAMPGMGDIVGAQLSNLSDVNGNPVEGEGNGSYASYNFSFLYQYVEPLTIASEFTPASGESLEGVDQIEIWFNNADAISFDGVDFAYKAGKEILHELVALADLNIESANNQCTILCPVPDKVKGHTDITVTLHNLSTPDGYDHSNDIRALYDQFVATLLAPIADGSRISYTGDDDFIVTINIETPYLRYDFYNGNEWYYGTSFTKQEDGTYTAYNGNYPCYSNVDNRMVIRAYATEQDFWDGKAEKYSYTFHFLGAINPFVYSSYNFVSIDPEPGTTITNVNDFCFTLRFDGLVKIDRSRTGIIAGMGGGLLSFEKIEAIDPEEGEELLANTWQLYPGNSYMQSNSSIDISITAYDQNGYLIQGNMVPDSEFDYLQFSYAIAGGSLLKAIKADPAEGTVSSLDVITLSCEGYPVGINYNCTDAPSLASLNTDYYVEFTEPWIKVSSEITGEDETGNPVYSEETVVQLILPEAVTAPDSYKLVVPAECLMIGSQFDTYYNKELVVLYTVESDGIHSIAFDGADIYVVYNMQGQCLMRTTDAERLATLSAGLYIVNGKKVFIR